MSNDYINVPKRLINELLDVSALALKYHQLKDETVAAENVSKLVAFLPLTQRLVWAKEILKRILEDEHDYPALPSGD